MNDCILISDIERPLEWFAEKISALGKVWIDSSQYPQVTLMREGDDQYLFIGHDPHVSEIYASEPEDDAVVRSYIATPHYLVVSFLEVDIVNQFLRILAGNGTFVIDNDHDYIAPLEEVLQRIDKGEAWFDFKP